MITIISHFFLQYITMYYFLQNQGTKLRVFPREIAAYDQDLGINANIFYTLNSGWYILKIKLIRIVIC